MEALEDEKALVTLAQEYFDKTNFGAVTGTGTPLRAVLRELRQAGRDADARKLLVNLSSKSLGEEPPMGKNSFEQAALSLVVTSSRRRSLPTTGSLDAWTSRRVTS